MEKNKTSLLASEQIDAINGGFLDVELGEALAEVVNAVLATGKKGTVTMKLDITAQHIGQGTIRVAHDIKKTIPKEKREGGIMFAMPSGKLTPNDPAQKALDLTVVKEEKPLLRAVK